jgi:hypothetical protein
MTIDKHNTTQQRQEPLSLSQALFLSLSPGRDLGLPVRRMPNSRRDPEEQRAFLRSMLEQVIEIANEVEAFFREDSSSENTDGEGEEENSSSSHNQNQNQ